MVKVKRDGQRSDRDPILPDQLKVILEVPFLRGGGKRWRWIRNAKRKKETDPDVARLSAEDDVVTIL